MQSYRLASLDQMLALPDAPVRYDDIIPVQPQPPHDPFVAFDAHNAALAQDFAAMLHWQPPLRAGLCRLQGFDFIGEWSLPLHRGLGSCLVDPALGWSAEHLDALIPLRARAGHVDWDGPGQHAVTLARRELANIDEAVVLSAPGQHVYGHWIIDFLPRLHILHTAGVRGLPVLLNAAPDWTAGFLRAFAIEHRQLRSLAAGTGVAVARAIIPTVPKHYGHIAFPLLRDAVQAFRRYMLAVPLPPERLRALPRSARYFVRRTGAVTRMGERGIANLADLEAIAVQAGCTPISPERFTLREQVHLFRDARLIVGAHGSALHNIAFAQPGCALGVVTEAGGFSPFHASLCHQLGHRVGYLAAGSGEQVDVAAFRGLLACLGA